MTEPQAAGRVAWFHCFAGIAGDMAFGSLVDAGADLDEVIALLRRLPISGWEVRAEPVLRGGIGATALDVRAEDTSIVRTHTHIVGLIHEARLPGRVRDRALAVFDALAAAEGRIHRKPAASVHFHEVGAIDAIIDIVGACAALEVLGVDDVRSSPIATGLGMTRSAHGLLPNPPPAVVELLRGVPTFGRDVPFELTTPTGAAIVGALATGHGPLPRMRIETCGYGAGSRDLDALPNVTQVVVGTDLAQEPAPGAGEGQPVVELSVNVDDATGEVLAHTVAALVAAGAYDAWITPAVMKKGRPAHVVSALADPALAADVAQVLVQETGSFGVRGHTMQRWPAARSMEEVDVEGLPVRVKVGPGRVKAEFADAARVAELTGLPLREVTSIAEASARRRDNHGTADGSEPGVGGSDSDHDDPA